MSDPRPAMTCAPGAAVADKRDIVTATARGPALLRGVWPMATNVPRAAIPDRRMQGRGRGAYGDGAFSATGNVARGTEATTVSPVGEATPMFTRFSTVDGRVSCAA